MQELAEMPVSEVMQRQVVSAQASSTVQEFVRTLSPHAHHEAFPVFDKHKLLGAVTLWSLVHTPPGRWNTTTIRSLLDRRIGKVSPDCDVSEALRVLLGAHRQPLLLVVSGQGKIQGVVTKTDILHALRIRREETGSEQEEGSAIHEIAGLDEIVREEVHDG